MKFYFIFLITWLIFSHTSRFAFAIDFFEINNPKFIPVNVGLVTNTKPEVVAIQNVFKVNINLIKITPLFKVKMLFCQ